MVGYNGDEGRMPRSHLDAIEGHAKAKQRTHPIKLGEVIDGKRVVMTCWEWTPEEGNFPVFKLYGESATRKVSKMIRQNGHECVVDKEKIRRVIDVDEHEELLRAKRDLDSTRATLIVNYAENSGRCMNGIRLTDDDTTCSVTTMMVKVLEQFTIKLKEAGENNAN